MWEVPRDLSNPLVLCLILDDSSSVISHNFSYLKNVNWDFPVGPVVKALPSNAEGMGLIPGQGAKIPHVSQP